METQNDFLSSTFGRKQATGSDGNGFFESPSFLSGDNAHFVEVLYEQYLADPNSVSEEWRDYFSQLTASAPASQPQDGTAQATAGADLEQQVRVLQLINAYRVRGHFNAELDPLGIAPKWNHPELDPGY